MIVGWEWMWQRTKRLADMLRNPNILDGAIQIVEALDNYSSRNQLTENAVTLGDAKFIKGLQYVEYPLTHQ